MSLRSAVCLMGCALATTAVAQTIAPPAVQWQITLGAGAADQLRGLTQTEDGGYLVGGFSNGSTNEIKTSEGFGGIDYWVVRLNAAGSRVWDLPFGGTGQDYLRALAPTADGGSVLGGHSNSSTNGNKTSPLLGSGIQDLGDFWVVRLDASGNKLWDKSYGGSDDDVLFSVQQTTDGGFIFAGHSFSADTGNKSATNHGMSDFWIVRTDADGEILWDRSFGGDGFEILYSARETADGGFLLGGLSTSGITGNKTAAGFGNEDMWIVRLDANGNKLWDVAFGGTAGDGLFSFKELADGGFMLGGYSASPAATGNKTSPHHGMPDFWIIRIDNAGTKLWEKTFGGGRDDQIQDLEQTADGGFLLGGYSYSRADGNKTSPNFSPTDPPANDFWLIRLNANGDKLWEQIYGGTSFDSIHAMDITVDGGVVLGGDSSSGINGNKTSTAYGQQDYWVVKLGPDALSAPPRLTAPIQTAAEIQSLGFKLHLHGVSNVAYVIDYSTALPSWLPLQTNAVGAPPLEITDPGASTSPHRFYRARLAP